MMEGSEGGSHGQGDQLMHVSVQPEAAGPWTQHETQVAREPGRAVCERCGICRNWREHTELSMLRATTQFPPMFAHAWRFSRKCGCPAIGGKSAWFFGLFLAELQVLQTVGPEELFLREPGSGCARLLLVESRYGIHTEIGEWAVRITLLFPG
ncbi:hypothetical protein VTI74DRAFT_1107 [Chaetomium olivicolor]